VLNKGKVQDSTETDFNCVGVSVFCVGYACVQVTCNANNPAFAYLDFFLETAGDVVTLTDQVW
jgi:hypothetical protein